MRAVSELMPSGYGSLPNPVLMASLCPTLPTIVHAICRGLVQKVGSEASRLKDERQTALQQKGELSVRAAALTQVRSGISSILCREKHAFRWPHR